MQLVIPRIGYIKQPFIVQDELGQLANPWNRISDEQILGEFRFIETMEALRRQLGDACYYELLSQWNAGLTRTIESTPTRLF